MSVSEIRLLSPTARYIAQRRQQASDEGRALPRLEIPSVMRAETGVVAPESRATFLVTPNRRTFNIVDLNTGDEHSLDDMAELVLPKNAAEEERSIGSVVVPDRATALRLIEHVQPRHRDLARALEMSLSALSSSRFVVLSEALGRKFYAPTEMDPNNINAWSTLFEQRADFDGMRYLASLVYGKSSIASALLRHATANETHVWAGIMWRSMRAECGRFRNMESITSAWRFAESTDRYGREEARQSGIVFDLTYEGRADREHRFRIAGSFNAKEGKRLIVLSDGFADPQKGKRPSFSVEKVDVIKGSPYIMSLSQSVSGLNPGDTITVTEEPYLPMSRGRSGRKWVEGVQTAVNRGEVPMWLALAGGLPD